MLKPKDQTRAKLVRAVSSVSFAVHGDGAFDRTIAAAAQWIRAKNDLIRADAESGVPFDVGGGGDHTARAIREQFGNTHIWAATVDDPDAAHLGRTWVTEMTIVQHDEETLFGSRLFNVTRGADEHFQPSVPGAVRNLVDNIPCFADGRMLSSGAEVISQPDQVERLIALIEKDERKLPVVVIADARITREPFADADTVARRLTGAAHVFRIEDPMTWELSRELGRQLSVFDGGARIYAPGLRRDEADPFDHPLWVTRAGASFRPHGDPIVSWVLLAGGKRTDEYPRFAAVREAAVAYALKKQREDGDAAALGPLYEEENARLETELVAVRGEFNQWLKDVEEEQAATSRKIQELQADVARFRSRYEQMRAALQRGETSAPRDRLQDLANFGSWVQQNVGPNIWFAPKAIRAVEKNGQFANPGLIGDAIHMLEDQYVAMKREPGRERVEAYQNKLNTLGLEDTRCFANRDTLKSYPEYALTYRGERHWCDYHLKYGGGADPKTMFRIYFTWDETEQVVLVGHLPTHLDNKMTN